MRFLVWRVDARKATSWRSWRADQRERARTGVELVAIAAGALLLSLVAVGLVVSAIGWL